MNVVLIRSNPVRPYPRLEKMANCLIKRGYGITVLAWDRDEDYAPKEEVLHLQGGDARIVRIGIKGQFAGGIKKNLKGLMAFQRFIRQWLRQNRDAYDVIHAYDFDTGYTAMREARRLHKVLIYDIPDYYCDSHGYTGLVRSLIKRLEDSVINRAFATIICTEERKKQIEGTRPRRLLVIHNTPDIQEQPDRWEPGDRLRIAYIGIFGRTRFLEEMTNLVAGRDDCELHIGGFGANMESWFETMAARHENITYYGRVPYQKTLEIESMCDVMFAVYSPEVPNHRFAAPNKFYEALALGKPLIMAKRTGMASVVDEYDIGETIEYDQADLKRAIDRLIARRAEWPEMRRRERELYASQYSWSEMERRIHGLYDEVNKSLRQG